MDVGLFGGEVIWSWPPALWMSVAAICRPRPCDFDRWRGVF